MAIRNRLYLHKLILEAYDRDLDVHLRISTPDGNPYMSGKITDLGDFMTPQGVNIPLAGRQYTVTGTFGGSVTFLNCQIISSNYGSKGFDIGELDLNITLIGSTVNL
jgi:hypothetical protein